MPNTITPAKRYITLLDEVYMGAALTSPLESDSALSRVGAIVYFIFFFFFFLVGFGE